MALVGGVHAPPGRIMGHAGAWTSYGEPDAKAKYEALERAGVVMVDHPENFGAGMKALLRTRGRIQSAIVGFCLATRELTDRSSPPTVPTNGEVYIR